MRSEVFPSIVKAFLAIDAWAEEGKREGDLRALLVVVDNRDQGEVRMTLGTREYFARITGPIRQAERSIRRAAKRKDPNGRLRVVAFDDAHAYTDDHTRFVALARGLLAEEEAKNGR